MEPMVQIFSKYENKRQQFDLVLNGKCIATTDSGYIARELCFKCVKYLTGTPRQSFYSNELRRLYDKMIVNIQGIVKKNFWTIDIRSDCEKNKKESWCVSVYNHSDFNTGFAKNSYDKNIASEMHHTGKRILELVNDDYKCGDIYSYPEDGYYIIKLTLFNDNKFYNINLKYDNEDMFNEVQKFIYILIEKIRNKQLKRNG